MFQRILLAYDGSLEGAVALREGTLLAKRMGAKVFILSVVPEAASLRVAEGVHGGIIAQQMDSYEALLQKAVARLKEFGFDPVGRLVTGDPARQIGKFAKEVHADLVVVGHRQRSMIERWWSGGSGSFISDYLHCSLLIARNVVSDAAFEAALHADGAHTAHKQGV